MKWFYLYQIFFGIPSCLFLFYFGIKYICYGIDFFERKIRGWE